MVIRNHAASLRNRRQAISAFSAILLVATILVVGMAAGLTVLKFDFGSNTTSDQSSVSTAISSYDSATSSSSSTFYATTTSTSDSTTTTGPFETTSRTSSAESILSSSA